MKILELNVPNLEVETSEKGFTCRTKTKTCPFLVTEMYADICSLNKQHVYRDNEGTGYLVPLDKCVMSKLY